MDEITAEGNQSQVCPEGNSILIVIIENLKFSKLYMALSDLH